VCNWLVDVVFLVTVYVFDFKYIPSNVCPASNMLKIVNLSGGPFNQSFINEKSNEQSLCILGI